MKTTFILAAALLTLGACSHRPTRANNAEVSSVSSAKYDPTNVETGTVSSAPTSLGAVSSGRGH